MAPIRVLIADDMGLHRELLRRLLERQSDIEVIGEACSPEEVLQRVAEREPDVVLMDLHMPRHDPKGGIRATQQLALNHPRVKVIALTESDDENDVRAVTLAGAKGYVLKNSKAERIAEAIRNVHGGKGWLDPDVTQHVLGDYRRANREAGGRFGLTTAEQQVLQLVASGLTARAIGEQLFMAEKTVKNHLGTIYRKLDVRNSSQAVAEGYRRGLIA